LTNSSPSEFTTTCTFCSGVSSVTLTGAHDELDVLCPRCGTYLGSVGELKKADAGTERAASVAAKKPR
jgi:hypothetical protein